MIKLEEGEQALYVARRHWFLFASETVLLSTFAALPAALLLVPDVVLEELSLAVPTVLFHAPFLWFVWSLWLLLLWTVFALLWTNYYLDVWILTNHRIIDIDQLGLFHQHVSSFRYDQIQDATVKVSGLLATLVGFGTVEIHTASNESFKFRGVAAPTALKERIMSEHHRVHAAAVTSNS